MADNGSGGMTAIVAIVAIVLIVGIGYFLFQNYAGGDAGDGPSINVDVPTPGGE